MASSSSSESGVPLMERPPAQTSRELELSSARVQETEVPLMTDCKPETGADGEGSDKGDTGSSAFHARSDAQKCDAEEPTLAGIPLRWLSLAAVTVQTSAAVLLIKWSKAEHREVAYLNSTVVFFTEVVKMFASTLLVLRESETLFSGVGDLLGNFSNWDVLKAAIPSLVYTFQNNLTFYSLEYLTAPEMQVLYQMKVLTTAGLSVLILGTVLDASKWSACFLLVLGIAMVQWPRGENGLLSGDLVINPGKVKGFLAVLGGCTTKAFASVFIEKLLKQTQASVWMRNVQFGFFGAIISLCMSLIEDGPKIWEAGLTQGYTSRVVVVIFVNANGGLLVAAMLKYAGATLGCFSTALSIILTCVISATVLNDELDYYFVTGAAITVCSALMYGLGLPAWLQSPCKRCCCGDCSESNAV